MIKWIFFQIFKITYFFYDKRDITYRLVVFRIIFTLLPKNFYNTKYIFTAFVPILKAIRKPQECVRKIRKSFQNVKYDTPYTLVAMQGLRNTYTPYITKKKRIICVHISGYRDNLKRSIRLKKNTQSLCTPIFEELYLQLSCEKPNQKTVLAFIKPLEFMIKQLYLNCLEVTKTNTPQNTVYLKSLQYINDNYMNDISAESIAKQLGYSASYIRAIFKKESGVSLQNKINDTRLENSAFLLKNTSMSVTDIAFHCGFSDSNYFSTIFKKKYGISPLAYRKSENQ